MNLTIDNDILIGAQIVESPNQNARPERSDIELLVIHNISLPPGEYGTSAIKQFFCNELDSESHPFYREIADLKVSAHLLIDRVGRFTQFVPFSRRAWHAGESIFCERRNCNDYSIGIELEGTDLEPFTDSQYTSLRDVTELLLSTYPKMSSDKIVGHSDIAGKRKTDPGPCFDWARYKHSLSA
ncbi:MAG: 1,6-anhydro-N-acetylmuramyl-L-alanine amidase AmpD [Gammaproteobacteria bacterium]|nr:1,6-anhydro-N-acetylmuramyl-L-alanine amidase AmpD [Gammaproteobacteria bacterium]